MASQEPIPLHSGHAQNEKPIVTGHLWKVYCKSASFRNSVRETEGRSQSSRAAFNCLNCNNTLLSPLRPSASFTIDLPAWQQMRQHLNILQSLPTSIMNNLHQPRSWGETATDPFPHAPNLSDSSLNYLHPVSSFSLFPFWFPRYLYGPRAPYCQLPSPNPAPQVSAHTPFFLLLL